MVLDELDAGGEVCLVEFVWDVPAEGAELPSLLDGGVEEGDRVQHGFPLVKVGDVQLLLADAGVGAFEACLHSLRGLIGELDAGLNAWDKLLDVT